MFALVDIPLDLEEATRAVATVNWFALLMDMAKKVDLLCRTHQTNSEVNVATMSSTLYSLDRHCPIMPESTRNSSSRSSLRTLDFTRGDETTDSDASSTMSASNFTDAVERQGDTQIRFRVLPFLEVARSAFETADDEYYLLPCYAKRVMLRRGNDLFALRIPDVRVEEVEMRLGLRQGGRKLAIEYAGRGKGRTETVVLSDRRTRIWKELDKCLQVVRDVRSVVLVMRDEQEKAGSSRRRNRSSLRSAVRSMVVGATSR